MPPRARAGVKARVAPRTPSTMMTRHGRVVSKVHFTSTCTRRWEARGLLVGDRVMKGQAASPRSRKASTGRVGGRPPGVGQQLRARAVEIDRALERTPTRRIGERERRLSSTGPGLRRTRAPCRSRTRDSTPARRPACDESRRRPDELRSTPLRASFPALATSVRFSSSECAGLSRASPKPSVGARATESELRSPG